MANLRRVSVKPPGFIAFGIGLTYDGGKPVYVNRQGAFGNSRPVYAEIATLVRQAGEAYRSFKYIAVSADTLARLWAEQSVTARLLEQAQDDGKTISFNTIIAGTHCTIRVYPTRGGARAKPYVLCDATGQPIKKLPKRR